jgi:hypothetical protein
LRRFEDFVKDTLLATDAGKAEWRKWAGERTLDEVMVSEGEYVSWLILNVADDQMALLPASQMPSSKASCPGALQVCKAESRKDLLSSRSRLLST